MKTGAVRPSAAGPLAFDALEGGCGAILVSPAERRGAVVVAEIELREVAVQVLLSAVLTDATYAALEDQELAFNRVRVDLAAPGQARP